MSIMISELYDALTEAGSTTQTARKAAQAVADLGIRMTNLEVRMTAMETELRMLKWMTGFNMILLIAILGINFQMYLEVLEILKTASAN